MERAESSQRIDRWLWHARFAKSRSLAQKLIASGCVRIDRERAGSSSQKVGPGNVLTLAIGRTVRIIEIVALANRRGPFSEASKLYTDRTPVVTPDETAGSSSIAGIERLPRPDRRKRREAIRLKQDFPDS